MRLALAAVASAMPDCAPQPTPAACLNTTGCAWLTLSGACADAASPRTLLTPPSCCASQTPGSPCEHRTADLPDGSCSVPGTGGLQAGEFDLAKAQRMAHFAGATYCSPDQITHWNCGPHCDGVPEVSDVTLISNTSQVLQGLVAFDKTLDAVVVAFRGTISKSITDWVHDMGVSRISPLTQYPDALVHHGFWDSWKAVEAEVVAAVGALLKKHPGVTVMVSGHSLGAAIATDAAMDMKLSHGWTTALVNFGSPRPGNQVYAEALGKEISFIWRLTHNDDLVPHSPPESFGFYHAAREIFFPAEDPTNLTYQVCDDSGEDPQCSDQCAGHWACTSVVDHLHYAGFELDSANCAPSLLV